MGLKFSNCKPVDKNPAMTDSTTVNESKVDFVVDNSPSDSSKWDLSDMPTIPTDFQNVKLADAVSPEDRSLGLRITKGPALFLFI
jgi:hypothetical protein